MFYFLFLIISLSQAAITAGNNISIRIAEHKVPTEIVLQIIAAIADAKFPTIKVTNISIEADVIIV